MSVSSLLSTHKNSDAWQPVIDLMNQGVADEVFPGGVLLVSKEGRSVCSYHVGARTLRPNSEMPQEINFSTVYDVASLTTVLVTVSMLMHFSEKGLIDPSHNLSRYIQAFAVQKKSTITIEQLLNHCSGFPGWVPFFQDILKKNNGSRLGMVASPGAKEHVYHAVNRAKLKYKPGTKQVYSDVGMIALGQLIEYVSGSTLDKAVSKYLFSPMKLGSTSFIDLGLVKRKKIAPVFDLIAPTEVCSWRKRELCGEVHDDNAWVMGGIAGHAGLFSNASDILTYSNELLRAYVGESELFSSDTIKHFWKIPEIAKEESSWCLGWDSPSLGNDLHDIGFSSKTRGINSFTGCSLWLDPEKMLNIVFLSNRINPSRSNNKIRAFRKELMRRIITAS